MRVLLQGAESAVKISALIRLTNIRSEFVIAALVDHLQIGKGYNRTAAAMLNGVSMPNFNRALNTLNECASIVEEIINERT